MTGTGVNMKYKLVTYLLSVLIMSALVISVSSGLAVGASASKLLVADYDDNMVYVVDPGSGRLLKNISVGSNPVKVVVDPTGVLAYVLQEGDSNISIINIERESVERTIPSGDQPTNMAISPDGLKLYVTSFNNNAVYVINTKNGNQDNIMHVGSGPSEIVFTSDGIACVANSIDNAIMVIDTSGSKPVKTLNVGVWPEGIGIDPFNRQALIPGFVDGTITIIEINGWSKVQTTSIGGNPLSIAYDVSSGVFYVTDPTAGQVRAVDPQGEATLIASVPGARSIITESQGNHIYVASPDRGTISIITTGSNEQPSTYRIGHKPTSIAPIYTTMSGTATPTVTPVPTPTPTIVPVTPTPPPTQIPAPTPTATATPVPTPLSSLLAVLALGTVAIGLALKRWR